MKIDRICKICGKKFTAIKSTQYFCCRKCFKKSYYLTTKIRLAEEKRKHRYPQKKCEYCEKFSELDFDPIRIDAIDKFDNWKCPHCGVSNKMVWKYQDKENSYQIISSFVSAMSITGSVTVNTEYHVYHLPVVRPEQGNDSIVVMTCKPLDILDLQRKNRRKISFS